MKTDHYLFRRTEKNFTPVAIISAERTDRTAEQNQARTAILRDDLVSLFGESNVEQCTGRYKGITEQSFIVNAQDLRKRLGSEQKLVDIGARDILMHMGFKYGQESIIIRWPNGEAVLHYIGRAEARTLGEFHQINPKLLDQFNNYTIINSSGVAFACHH